MTELNRKSPEYLLDEAERAMNSAGHMWPPETRMLLLISLAQARVAVARLRLAEDDSLDRQLPT